MKLFQAFGQFAAAGAVGPYTGDGYELLIPTSVATTGGGTASLSGGKVSFSSAAQVNVNGVFSSKHYAYNIIVRASGSTNSGIDMRLRASGTDNTSSIHARQFAFYDNATITKARNTSTDYMDVGEHSAANAGRCIWVLAPSHPKQKSFLAHDVNQINTIRMKDTASIMNSTSLFDGFTIYPSGTWSGELMVYGYRSEA